MNISSFLQYHKILSTPINSLKLVKIKTQIPFSLLLSSNKLTAEWERKSIKWSFYLLNSFLTPSDYAINPLPFKYLLNNSQTRKFFLFFFSFFFLLFLCSVLLFNELERTKFAYNQLDCHKSTSLLSLSPPPHSLIVRPLLWYSQFLFIIIISGQNVLLLIHKVEWVTEKRK